ncbi:hypothetical protein [Streptomyces botrytidirepellens]|uniref:Uncharacterized protein n=1 Tax=Streptomyces botrytidirepellens TaxID=2486417 RepID=A0A3M8VWR6_9ACTN|nr:hypothetical protein [Streptomyces botrytidirepellens]RNG22214.1 hypothetical protein EEJ42_21920 [Streptomyces botrytidirepellens]
MTLILVSLVKAMARLAGSDYGLTLLRRRTGQERVSVGPLEGGSETGGSRWIAWPEWTWDAMGV